MLIRQATAEDVAAIKKISDANKQAIGFVLAPALIEAQTKGWLWVAELDTAVAGFCNVWKRRDGWTTILEICVVSEFRGQGIGQALINALQKPLRAKCPVDNESNGFYQHLGFELVRIEQGGRRQLNVWQLI